MRQVARSRCPAAFHGLALSRKVWANAGVGSILFGVVALFASLNASSSDWWIHGAWCLLGMVSAIVLLARALRDGFIVVVTDHLVMFTAAFTLYFLFGASFMTFGPEDQVSRALRYYYVDAVSALKADAVNGIGFGVALLVAVMSPRRWFFQHMTIAARKFSKISSHIVLFVLLSFGLSAYGYTLVYDFGFMDGVVPGVVRAASKFSIVSIFLAASYRGKYSSLYRTLALFLSVTLTLSGVLLFNKTQILVPLAALVAGFALVYRPKVVVPVGLLILIAIYIGTSGLVLYGRNTLGTASLVPLSVRFTVALEGVTVDRKNDPLAEASPWGRLCYIAVQGAGMDFYDQGAGASEFSLIPWLFVPRLLSQDKPIITKTNEDFHQKISGHEGSSTGQGVFSSGYYSGGWIGAFAAAVLAGWILAQTSAVASAIMTGRAMILQPFALYGVYIAFRIDGSFLADYAGAFVFLLYPLLAFWFLTAASRSNYRM